MPKSATAAAAPAEPTEVKRRSFTLVPFDHAKRLEAAQLEGREATELAEFLETVDATEEIDWQLRKLLRVDDELRNAIEREKAAKAVREFYEAQREQLGEFISVECREKYEELIAREKKGSTKFTDHALTAAGRRDLIVRVGLRSLPAVSEVYDKELLISTYSNFIDGPGKLKEGAPTWLKWVEPVQGQWDVAKAELNKAVKAGDNLPGVEIIEKPDKLYFEDKSRREK